MPDQDPRGDAIRVPIDRNQPLPDPSRYLHPPCLDADDDPVYFGSATLGNVVQPCKVTRKGDELVCVVPHRLFERIHRGPFTVLPLTDAMELVPTSHGRIPAGYRPVEGGMDEKGRALYHAVAWVRGERIPGRTCERLGAAAVLLGGREHYVYDAYEILCWRDEDEIAEYCAPERHVPIYSPNPSQVTSARPGHTRPGDNDPAGTHLRVTVTDLSTVTSHPASTDLDGTTPLYFGSAILPGEVYPGKVVQTHTCQVLHDDAVVEHSTGFSILPFNAEMELVSASQGVVPPGRRPVEGNYDAQGRKLYHAMLYVVGRQFPGMCAEHLGGARGVVQGRKYASETGYSILCWKERAGSSSAPPGDPLQQFSYKDDLAGQRLRKPFNGNEPLTESMGQGLGEHIPNQLDQSHWFFASVLYDGSITPCWAYPSSTPSTFAFEGGTKITTCTGPYSILPFLRDRMVLVTAVDGKIPEGATPVEGGRDTQGRVLYHAIGWVSSGDRGRMIGMAAEHLGGAVIICWGKVHRISRDYELLCWKT